MCTIGTLKTYIVEVQDNRVQSLQCINGKTSEWIKQSDTSWMNVDYFFNIIGSPSTAAARTVFIQYDEILGYPTLIGIDSKWNVVDDELYVRINRLIPIKD